MGRTEEASQRPKMMSLVCLMPFPLVGLCSTMETPEKIKKDDVQVLTLRAGHMTTGRRRPPVPQIRCIGGCGMWGVWEPSVVQCRRIGYDDQGQDQWRCESYSPVRLHDVNITCEGFNYDEDDFILPGSCGLQYYPVFFLASLEFWGEVRTIIPLVIGVIASFLWWLMMMMI